MKNIKKLSDSELASTARQIEAEAKLRANRKAATKAILTVLKKHKRSVADLSELGLKADRKTKRATKAPAKRGRPAKASKANPVAKKAKSTDKRAKVAMKYKNPTSSEQWTGRGRAPKWVAEILTKRKITIAQFKNDGRYKI